MRKTGDAYFDSDEFREMLAEYEEALENDEPVLLDADDLAEIADYYHMMECYDEADEAIDFALSLAPGAVAPLTYKIHEALWNGDIEHAREYLGQITETDEPDYVYDKAEIMIAEERVDDADAYLLKEFSKVPKEERQDFIVDVANIYQDYFLCEKSLEWMQRAHQENSPDFMELKARAYFGLGKFDDSERIWGDLVDIDPFSAHYWNALASTQFMKEDYSNSVQSSEYAIAINPDDTEALLTKADGLYHLKNYEEALKYFRRYSEHEPNDEHSLLFQGVCLNNLRRQQEAIPVLEKALKLCSGNEDESPYLYDIYQQLALSYSDVGNADKAIAVIDEHARHNATPEHAFLMKGHVMLAAHDEKKAREYFREALEHSDSPIKTMSKVIITFYDNKLVNKAYSMFKEYFRVADPKLAEGHAYMALCCFELRHFDEFLEYLKKACDKDLNACRAALGHLFPEDIEPQDYYNYIKDSL